MSGRAAISPLRDSAILELDPSTIDVDLSGRIGFYFEDKARAFGQMLREDGQRDLVKISRAPKGHSFPWRLHVGLHRTMGALFEGIPIYAIEVKGTADQLRELETSENLHRRTMEPLERAKFVAIFAESMLARLNQQRGEMSQQKLASRARWDRARNSKVLTEAALQEESDNAEDTMSAVYGWQDAAAEAFGFDKRTIRRSIKIYRQLIAPFPAELVRALADHPVVGKEQKQLLDLASIEVEALRLQAIESLIADHSRSLADVLIDVGVAQQSGPSAPIQKSVDAIKGNLDRLSAWQQKQYLSEFVGALKSDDVKRQLRDMLNRELGDA